MVLPPPFRAMPERKHFFSGGLPLVQLFLLKCQMNLKIRILFLFEICTFTTLGAGQVVTVSTFDQFSHVSFLSNLQRIDFCLPTTPGAIKANQRIEKTKIF